MAPDPDVLRLLDRLLATTPESVAMCRPLPRALVARVAAEIRTLRQQLQARDTADVLTQKTPES